MSALRKLALCYLVSASAFGLAAGLSAWPQASRAVDGLSRLFIDTLWRPAAAGVQRAAAALLEPPMSDARVVLALAPPGPADGRTLAHVALPPIAPRQVEAPSVTLALEVPVTIAPDLPPLPPQTQASAAPARPAEVSPRLPVTPLTQEQLRARARLAATLTPEMRAHFDLFLFVSKASHGPLAQRLYVFRKSPAGMTLLYDWAASTGREKEEVNARGESSFTATPAGIYQFDPDRMYRQYHSYNWDQDMPYAMFFNWQREGLQTGLAIHAAGGDDIARLGERASAGCIHLAPENARTLFNLVRDDYRGQVPRFAIDGNDTMSSKGQFSRRPDGSLRMADGYRVLIDIENYSGADGSDAVALF